MWPVVQVSYMDEYSPSKRTVLMESRHDHHHLIKNIPQTQRITVNLLKTCVILVSFSTLKLYIYLQS